MKRAWLLLVFAAALALWLWRSPRDEPADTAVSGANRQAEPGYVALDAELFETDGAGQPQYRLRASRMEQADPKADIALTAPEFHYRGDTEWTLTAERGILPPAAQQVTLTGNVLTTAQQPGQPALQIRTATLAIDMPKQQLDTREPVAMDWGRNRLWAVGLHVDMKADSLRLESHVLGEYARQ